MMFSATMIPQIEKLAREYLHFPAYVSVGEPGSGKKDIEQRIEFLSSESQRRTKLQELLQKYPTPPIIVFVNRKVDVESLGGFLDKLGFSVGTLHGNKQQDKREEALNGLKSGRIDVLIATNVAARGLDVEDVAHVINFHAPESIVDYVHRIGRTGRAGKQGMATTLLTAADEKIFYDLNKFLIENDQFVPRELATHPATKGAKASTVPTSLQDQKYITAPRKAQDYVGTRYQ